MMKYSMISIIIAIALLLSGCVTPDENTDSSDSNVTADGGVPDVTANVKVLDNYTNYIDEFGRYIIAGEVENNIGVNLSFVKVTATFYDSSDNVIATEYGGTQQSILKPNEKSSFRITLSPPRVSDIANIARYALQVEYQIYTFEIPYLGSQILSHSPSTDNVGYYNVVGEIKYGSADEARFISICATFYDNNGKVVEINCARPDTTISTGETSSFTISAYSNIPQIASYAIVIPTLPW